MAYEMSEGPSENCEFTKMTRITKTAKRCTISEGSNENYENYKDCEKFVKEPRVAKKMSEVPNENCGFYESYEN